MFVYSGAVVAGAAVAGAAVTYVMQPDGVLSSGYTICAVSCLSRTPLYKCTEKPSLLAEISER